MPSLQEPITSPVIEPPDFFKTISVQLCSSCGGKCNTRPYEFEDVKILKNTVFANVRFSDKHANSCNGYFNDVIYLDILSSGFENIQENEGSGPEQVCFLCASDLMPGEEQILVV